jgi:hypothetical protein
MTPSNDKCNLLAYKFWYQGHPNMTQKSFLSQGAVHLSVMLTDSWAWWTQHPSLSHKALHSKFHVILKKVWVSHLWPQPKVWGPGIGDKCVHSFISILSLSSHSNWREPTLTVQKLIWSFELRKWTSSGCFYNWMGKWLLARQCQVYAEQVQRTLATTLLCTAIHSICQHEVLCYQIWRKCHDVRHLMSKKIMVIYDKWCYAIWKLRNFYLMKVQLRIIESVNMLTVEFS